MSIITFWNALRKENGQTLSACAIATHMAVEHNYRILLVDANFDDNTMKKAFWKEKEKSLINQLNGGKMDISSGAEGLISAVASNKATPEIITNYTKIIFKNRLDVLAGLKTKIYEEFEKSLMLYKDLLIAANKFYDFVFVDLVKGTRVQSVEPILKVSNIILYTMPQNLANIDKYKELRKNNSIISSNKVVPLLARCDEASGYNSKNTTRYIKEKNLICTVPYNARFMEATNESRLASFVTSAKLGRPSGAKDGDFFDGIERTSLAIMDKIRELNQKR